MRNKKIFKYGALMAATVPFLAFSLVFAADRGTSAAVPQDRDMSQQADQTNQKQGDQGQNKPENKANGRTITRRMRAARVLVLMRGQIDRAGKVIDRLNNIMDRIESRRAKLAAAGADLSKVDPLIATAKTQKTAAVAAITKAKADWDAFKAIDAETNPTEARAAGKTFITSIMDVQKKLNSFHRTLVAIVKAMKSADKETK